MARILDRIAASFRSNPFNNPGYPMNEMNVNAFLEMMGGQHRADSGEIVNIHTSLQTSTVWACVNLISSQIATNPLNMYQYDANGNRSEATDHDYFDLINSKPNPYQDVTSFRTSVQVSVELTGNGFIELQRDNGGRVVAMWHRNSSHTRPFWGPGNVLAYETTDSEDQRRRVIKYEDMIHLMGMASNGFEGLNPLEFFRGSIGAKIALDKFAARFFANNANPSGIISSVQKYKPEAKTKMRADFEALQTGSSQHRIAVLDDGLKFEKISTTQNDAQFLETKVEVSKEIAAFFGVQGYAVGLLDKGIKANVEQQAQDLFTYCLRPRMTKWEKAFGTKLFNNKGRSAGRYFVKFDNYVLLHPDHASITTSNQSSIQNGVMTPNEGRYNLGLNGIGPLGDVNYIQLNMQTLEQANSVVPVTNKPDIELALEMEENSLPKRLGTNYRSSFKTGAEKLMNGSRDFKAVYKSLWSTVNMMATDASNGIGGDHKHCSAAVEDILLKIEHRAKKWLIADLEAIVSDEMKKVAKALIYAVRADEADVQAKKDVEALEAAATEQENNDEE